MPTHNIEKSERRLETRIARDQAKLAEIREKKNAKTPARGCKRARAEPQSEPVTKVARTREDEADQRFAIRYFYRKLDSPPEEDWEGYCGTISEIRRLMGHSLRLTWADYPSPERIVEDIQRLPITIEQIIAHKGCLVPEAAIHKKGCSRTKRKGQRGVHMSSAVSKVVHQRHSELRAKAEKLAVGL